jgi:hypothetical protein
VVTVRARGLRWWSLAPTAASELSTERVGLAWTAFALMCGAAGHFNAWAGLEGADRAWVFAALGGAAWLGLAWGRARLFGALVPPAVALLGLSAALAMESPRTATAVLLVGTAGPATAFVTTRRWSLWGIAAVFGAGALAAGRWWAGIDERWLPLGYAAVATALWAALLPRRRYERDERGIVVTALSWGFWVVAGIVALLLLDRRDQALGRQGNPAETREWLVLLATVLGSALGVTAEGLRLRQRPVWTAGTAGLLATLLMGIAIAEPGNVQAYTLPVGLYLIGLGASVRRSPELFGAHMAVHEAALAAGVLFLVLPGASQSFGPGGARYGLELIAIGLLVLLAGLTLSARWLVAGGVLTLSGVALRWLALFSTRAPGWLVLGIVGMALLGFGMLLLGTRDRWDRALDRLTRWWQDAPAEPNGHRPL